MFGMLPRCCRVATALLRKLRYCAVTAATLVSSRISAQPGHVYLVVGSDTAIWNAGTTVDVYTRHPHYSQDSFTVPGNPSFQVMDPSWRNQYRDSSGQPIKFTWWMMGGNIYRDADNVNVVPQRNVNPGGTSIGRPVVFASVKAVFNAV